RTLGLAVADGAGSAPLGSQGAEIATQAALGAMSARISSIADVASVAYRAIKSESESAGVAVSDFATTLLIARLTVTLTGIRVEVLQVGDGCIVACTHSHGQALTVPDRGEYANETYFLTSSRWAERAQISRRTLPFDGGVLLMTDGPCASLFNGRNNEVAAAARELVIWGRMGSRQVWARELQTATSTALRKRTQDDLGLAAAVLPTIRTILLGLSDWISRWPSPPKGLRRPSTERGSEALK
ncbi:MAG: PP2C family serine/threonine-protein phosphatase, partial [Candidatus Nanopelagicales bacterium]